MSESRCRKEQPGKRVPSAPHDPPWEPVLSVEHPHLASRHNVERETRLQSKIADIDNAFSDTASPETIMDQQAPKKWEGYENTPYPTGDHDRYHTMCGNSNSPQTLHYGNDTNTDASYSLPPGGGTAPASHSSPGEMTESSSTMETNFSETVRSNSPLSDSPDTGPSDPSRNSSNQGAVGNRPRPFSRKSKAGIEHTVTPARAGPDGGFICKFSDHGNFCGKSFKLPSDIRFHLIERHMTFSPFQCDKCKRVYTRKSLYTRHLKEGSQDSSTIKKIRQCPHRAAEADDAYRIRKNTYEALWAIQLSQEQVDMATAIILQYNGKLPSRRRRTQNTNEPDPRDAPASTGTELSQPAGHVHASQQTDGTGFHTQQASTYGPQTAATAYSSPTTGLMRVSSVPNLSTHQNTITHTAGNRRPTPVTCYNSGQAYDDIPPFQSQPDPNTLPAVQANYNRQYLDPAHALLSSQPRVPEYFGSQRFSAPSDSIAPQVLHDRQSSWDGSSIESNYGNPWIPGVRNGHNYREQMAFEGGSQASNYQYSTPIRAPTASIFSTTHSTKHLIQDGAAIKVDPEITVQNVESEKQQGPYIAGEIGEIKDLLIDGQVY